MTFLCREKEPVRKHLGKGTADRLNIFKYPSLAPFSAFLDNVIQTPAHDGGHALTCGCGLTVSGGLEAFSVSSAHWKIYPWHPKSEISQGSDHFYSLPADPTSLLPALRPLLFWMLLLFRWSSKPDTASQWFLAFFEVSLSHLWHLMEVISSLPKKRNMAIHTNFFF